VIHTKRLILRGWREADLRPYFAMGQDREVMRYIGPLATRGDVRSTHDRMNGRLARHGHCFWAVERKIDGRFLGFCGLVRGTPPIGGEVEIGWRLARHAWGQGYAREAAEASLSWAWRNLDRASIAGVTVAANVRSRALMERLGMIREPGGDFDHPELSSRDPLRRHIFYRIGRPAA
jgi:RimJ/RimL family protein N-acetyltransferase